MEKLKIDETTANVLKAATAGMELIGPGGETIGGFLPPKLLPDLQRMLAERKRMYDEALDALDPEKLRKLVDEEAKIPHDEVMKRLGLNNV